MLRAATTAALVAFALAPAAGVAWQGNMLAVRTSGGILRPGDTLRVELLALDTVFGPFRARVRYRFAEGVTVRDEEGGEREELRERVLERPPGVAIESLAPGQTVLLDDTFHLGSASLPGAYHVEVDILELGLDRPSDTIRACAHLPDDGRTETGCGFLLTGVGRINTGDWLTLVGRFPEHGWYRAALVRDGRVISLMDTGIYSTSRTELELTSPILPRLAGQTVDLVVHDPASNASATLSRLVIPVSP